MPGLKDRITDAGYGAGWSLVCRLPEAWTQRAFRFVADIAWRRQGPRVQVLEANLTRVLGPDADGKALRYASREVMRRYARYWLEIFRLPVMPVARLVDGMHDPTEQRRIIFDVLATGRGVVVAIPHMGNWDQAGAWIIAQGAGSFATVMERLKPETVYERFVTFREGLGMEVLPASGGSRPFGILAQRLRAGKIVILPCDRDVTGSGIEVEFFGEKAKMMAGPAALAVQTGAALIPAVLWFRDDGWGVRIGEEIPQPAEGTRPQKVAAMTQEIASFFESGIRDHPYDWLMLQKVFVSDLDPARQAAARERAAANGHLTSQEVP
ncbi:MAG TPA: phosphatidylinositol mannoside acyltransferase [Streptosporangiaceae bacterium]|jgi:KDO2-lipid IV(A) lauroyltransferase|nr:phosphatidylinositol mannoside acyltransferase [Streptosporangiaceae bacterium]